MAYEVVGAWVGGKVHAVKGVFFDWLSGAFGEICACDGRERGTRRLTKQVRSGKVV